MRKTYFHTYEHLMINCRFWLKPVSKRCAQDQQIRFGCKNTGLHFATSRVGTRARMIHFITRNWILRLCTMMLFACALASPAHGGSYTLKKAKKITKKKKKNKKGQLMKSIGEAMERSEADEKQIRVKVSFEADERISSWDDRETGVIQVRSVGASTLPSIDLGEADLSYEESGEDMSGLERLHSNIEDEDIEINFDEELRDVSSFED